MAVVPFETLPADARVWVFASDRPLSAEQAELLLGTVDEYLVGWRAHGQPLTCGRAWRDGRFLAIAVDQSDAYASGCSIDGMFRVLQQLQQRLGASLVGGGRVFYRDAASGTIQSVTRDAFGELGLPDTTRVFDPTVATVGEWSTRFETYAADSWHGALLRNSPRAASITERT
jgi:hypothetical protein